MQTELVTAVMSSDRKLRHHMALAAQLGGDNNLSFAVYSVYTSYAYESLLKRQNDQTQGKYTAYTVWDVQTPRSSTSNCAAWNSYSWTEWSMIKFGKRIVLATFLLRCFASNCGSLQCIISTAFNFQPLETAPIGPWQLQLKHQTGRAVSFSQNVFSTNLTSS